MVEKMYTIKEASAVLGLKVRTVREYIRKGKIKACQYKDGRMWHIKESDLLAVLEGEDDGNKG